jgi:hypothetical protein
MATYVNDLRLKEIATGDESGTWGTSTNTNLELIAEAFSYGTEVITTNADTHTTTIADGATDPGRSLYLKYTGTLDSACTITIGPNTVSKVWIIENGTSGSQDIILSQGSGANITIPAGDTKVVYSDGAGAGAAFFDAFASLSVVDLKVQDDLTVTGDIDVDGTTNLDVVDIDGAVDMASTALVTGVLTANGGAVFNEAGADVDFRVESDTVDHALFVQGSDGFVGIGTSSPSAPLHVDAAGMGDIYSGLIENTTTDTDHYNVVRFIQGASGSATGVIGTGGSATGNTAFRDSFVVGTQSSSPLVFTTNDTESLRIDASGNVDITYGNLFTDTTSGIFFSGGIGSFTNGVYGVGVNNMAFNVNGSERVRIDSSGNLLVGTTFGYAKLGIIQTTINEITGFFANNTSTNAACVKILQDGAGSSGPALLVRQDGSGNAITVDSVTDGNTVFSVSYNGALAKASGSFKINHPLEAKTDTHHLVHSFIEGPQADNIYRGKVDLVAGSATANIDTVAGMTEGTFVALNREVQCFTTNESNWDAVKGSVSGNILTIESENSESTATISWLVIGERKDQHMYDTDWTDENGKVIVEPLKD